MIAAVSCKSTLYQILLTARLPERAGRLFALIGNVYSKSDYLVIGGGDLVHRDRFANAGSSHNNKPE